MFFLSYFSNNLINDPLLKFFFSAEAGFFPNSLLNLCQDCALGCATCFGGS